MKLETFCAELFKRLDIPNRKERANEVWFAEHVTQTIDHMTGGAFFRSIERLSEDYVFPTAVDNG